MKIDKETVEAIVVIVMILFSLVSFFSAIFMLGQADAIAEKKRYYYARADEYLRQTEIHISFDDNNAKFEKFLFSRDLCFYLLVNSTDQHYLVYVNVTFYESYLLNYSVNILNYTILRYNTETDNITTYTVVLARNITKVEITFQKLYDVCAKKQIDLRNYAVFTKMYYKYRALYLDEYDRIADTVQALNNYALILFVLSFAFFISATFVVLLSEDEGGQINVHE